MGPVGVAEPPLIELTSLQTNVKVMSDSACTPSVILCRPLEFDRVGVPLPTGVNARLELFGEQSRKKRCFPCNSAAHSIENVLLPTGVWLGKPLLNGPAAERATLTIDLAQVRSQCSHSFLRALPPIGSLASARADLHIANVTILQFTGVSGVEAELQHGVDARAIALGDSSLEGQCELLGQVVDVRGK